MKINVLSAIILLWKKKIDYEELGPDPETDYPDMPEWVYDRFTKTE